MNWIILVPHFAYHTYDDMYRSRAQFVFHVSGSGLRRQLLLRPMPRRICSSVTIYPSDYNFGAPRRDIQPGSSTPFDVTTGRLCEVCHAKPSRHLFGHHSGVNSSPLHSARLCCKPHQQHFGYCRERLRFHPRCGTRRSHRDNERRRGAERMGVRR